MALHTTLHETRLALHDGSVLLIIESRMALGAIMSEMDFVWKVSQKYAGKDMTTKPGGPFTWLGRKI